jgi:hypothetical protein
MVGLIVSLVGGVFAGVLALLIGTTGGFALVVGAIGAIAVFVILLVGSSGTVPRHQAQLETLFPTPDR